MARPRKAVVDYFPLVCKWGDSMECIEETYGNDGFVCWVKLLQKLGRTEYHYFDYANVVERKKFFSKLRLPENLINKIINDLALFDCIDKELWKQGIIFSESFVESVADAYKDRILKPLYKKDIIKLLIEKNRISDISSTKNEVYREGNPTEIQNYDISIAKNPQSKLNETILNQTIENKSIENKTSSIEEIVEVKNDDDEFYKKFLSLISKIENYPFNEAADKNTSDKLKEIAQIVGNDKVFESVDKWVLQAMRQETFENDPGTRLLGWVKKCCEEQIKAAKKRESELIAAAENRRKKAEEEEKVAKTESEFNEKIKNLKSPEDACVFIKQIFSNPPTIFRSLPPYIRDIMANFGLTKEKVWG